VAADLDVLLARLEVLREEHAQEVASSRGLAQDTLREKGRVLLALVDQIEAIEKGATLVVNMRRRAEGLPPLKSFLELAADPTLGGMFPA
jgi:hypothetical protein